MKLVFSTLILIACCYVHAQDRHPIHDRLERVPRVWEQGPLHQLTLKEYEVTLDHWKAKHKDRLIVEHVGESAEKVGIYLMRISDDVDNEKALLDKQHALISCLHGGPERSGTTTAMTLIEWLLGDSREAAEVRKHQVVLVMPIINPYAYFVTDRFGNSQKLDPYTGGKTSSWDYETLTHKFLDKSSELAAFLKVVDRYQPEIHLDLHGTGLQDYPKGVMDRLGDKRQRYRGQTMSEITASASSNFSLRPWDWRVTERMIAAGMREGFPSFRSEADAQRLFVGFGMHSDGQFWRGRPQFYTAHYGYARYHTMLACLEIGWEASGEARSRGLLEMGNEMGADQFHKGYPVDRCKGFIGRSITAYGTTAAERRRSRTELWQKQSRMSHGILYPQTAGRDTYLVGLTDEGNKLLDGDLDAVLHRLDRHPDFDGKAVRTFMKSGPEIKLAMSKGNGRGALQSGRIENGCGVRLKIPYRKPEVVDVRINGHEVVPVDQAKGGMSYQQKFGDGYLQVQISIPPELAKKMDALVVTCAYVPNENRDYGWKPPAEVLRKLNQGQ